jgi:hypothetical protein
LPIEGDRFADTQPGSVEQLADRAVPKGDGRRACRGVEQAFDLGGRECPRQLPSSFRELDGRRWVVRARAQQHLVTEEGANGSEPAGDRRGCETVCAELSDVGGEIVGARAGR